MVKYMLVSLIVGMLIIVGCTPDAAQSLPTVASVPSATPQLANATDATTPTGGNNTSQPTDAADTDAEPTPTREGDVAPPPTADVLAGSGFGLGQMTTLTPFPLEGAGFAAEVLGSEEARITGDGAARCDEAGNLVISSTDDENTFPRILFIIPPATEAGAYPLVDVVQSGVAIHPVLLLDSGVTYDFQLNGTLVLDVLPSEAGGSASGAFEYGVSAIVDPTKTILVKGAFDFAVPADFCK